MAIFHLSAKVVSRGKGQSAIAKAAYNARAKLDDERTGQTKDYSRANGIVFSGVFAPKDAPEWASDRQQLWNEVERKEDASNRAAAAQLAREVVVALPHELTDQQREWLVKDFVREQFTRKGMIADVNIHEPGGEGDQRNHHAHILVTMRQVGPEGFGPKVREWNGREQVEKWREAWEHNVNKQLERHGHDARVDRRTLEAQGIEREPTTHRGPHVDAIERRGAVAENTRQNGDRLDELSQLKAELATVERYIVREEGVYEKRTEFLVMDAPGREAVAEGGAGQEFTGPEAANSNDPELLASVADLADTLEATPAAAAGAVNEFAGGVTDGLKMLGGLASLFVSSEPPPPKTKEEAQARKEARLEHAERMLHDRDYRRTFEAEKKKHEREIADRKREDDDERGRTRQR